MMLSSSFRFGSRQLPATDPSLNPHAPAASVPAASSACCQVTPPSQSAFLSQTKSVSRSVSVPFPLSMKRGTGHATPACTSPSWPVALQPTSLPPLSQHVVWPVLGSSTAGAAIVCDGASSMSIAAAMISRVIIRSPPCRSRHLISGHLSTAGFDNSPISGPLPRCRHTG